MPYNGLSNGLYLISQKCQVKGILVDHYGILDIGDRLNLRPNGYQPVVIHQTPPRIRTDWLENTGKWVVEGKISDEQYAIARINKALENNSYDLFGNNCEHFARFVATGKRESTQLQTVALVIAVIALVFIIVKSGEAA